MDAGKLRQRVQLLSLQKQENRYCYEPVKNTFAAVKVTGRTGIFSKIGIGAEGVEFILRSQPLTLHQGIRYQGEHYFITSITETGIAPRHLTVSAVKVKPRECALNQKPGNRGVYGGEEKKDNIITFPGFLTEKYLRDGEEPGHFETGITVVLVTPKEIIADAGKIITIDGKRYRISTVHDLDDYKNEYEVQRTEDD